MAVAENSVASSENNFETTDLERSNGNHIHNNEKIEKLSFKSQSMPKNDDVVVVEDDRKNNNKTDDLPKIMNFENGDTYDHVDLSENGDDDYENIKKNNRHLMNGKEEGFKKDIRDLQEMLSKLNPMAKEFVPTSLVNYRTINNNINANSNNFGFMSNFLIHPNVGGTGGNVNGFTGRKVLDFDYYSVLFSF